jgi:hypothetical protein
MLENQLTNLNAVFYGVRDTYTKIPASKESSGV